MSFNIRSFTAVGIIDYLEKGINCSSRPSVFEFQNESIKWANQWNSFVDECSTTITGTEMLAAYINFSGSAKKVFLACEDDVFESLINSYLDAALTLNEDALPMMTDFKSLHLTGLRAINYDSDFKNEMTGVCIINYCNKPEVASRLIKLGEDPYLRYVDTDLLASLHPELLL